MGSTQIRRGRFIVWRPVLRRTQCQEAVRKSMRPNGARSPRQRFQDLPRVRVERLAAREHRSFGARRPEEGHPGHAVPSVSVRERVDHPRRIGAVSPSVISAVSVGAHPSNSVVTAAVAAAASLKSMSATHSAERSTA
jgi:hypothetical protein